MMSKVRPRVCPARIRLAFFVFFARQRLSDNLGYYMADGLKCNFSFASRLGALQDGIDYVFRNAC